MSNFTIKVKRPDTGKIVEAEFLDNYFGHRQYGMRIRGEDRVRVITANNDKEIIAGGMTFKIMK